MGNEASSLSGCHIDDNPIMKFGTDYSLHHSHKLDDKSQMSVFISKDQLSDKKNLLAMMAKVMTRTRVTASCRMLGTKTYN